jgi:hypothetical protein
LKKAKARGYQLNCTGPIVGFIGSKVVDRQEPGIDICPESAGALTGGTLDPFGASGVTRLSN